MKKERIIVIVEKLRFTAAEWRDIICPRARANAPTLDDAAFAALTNQNIVRLALDLPPRQRGGARPGSGPKPKKKIASKNYFTR
jgi:hypothetical protein